MTKRFGRIKACFIMSIFIFSAIAIFAPTSSAGPLELVNCEVVLRADAENPEDLTNQIVPKGGSVTIPLTITASITGMFSGPTIDSFNSKNMLMNIHIRAVPTGEAAPYVTALVMPNVINVHINDPLIKDKAYLKISFTDDAPGLVDVKIDIVMESDPVTGLFWKIDKGIGTTPIALTPAFLPIIDVVPTSTYQEISPGEIAEFPFDLTNLGNEKTEFIFKVINQPKDWSVSILTSTKVGSEAQGEENTKTIKLLIQPPYGFGYHDEREDIKILVYGQYYAGGGEGGSNETLVRSSTEYVITVTVRSRGFSTPGFEMASMLLVFIVVFFILKKRQKIK